MAPTKKTMLFVCLLVAAVAVVVPIAQGNPVAQSVTIVTGKVFCTLSGNGTVGVNPPFPNALVELRCGTPLGILYAIGRTNSTGQFTLLKENLRYTVAQVLALCRVVVITPFRICNSTLPLTGKVSSNLTLNSVTTAGTFTLATYNATNFQRLP